MSRRKFEAAFPIKNRSERCDAIVLAAAHKKALEQCSSLGTSLSFPGQKLLARARRKYKNVCPLVHRKGAPFAFTSAYEGR